MALSIHGNMRVKTLKVDFKSEFGLTLRVYDGKSFADNDATLASIRKGDNKGGEFSPKRNTLVGNFEDKMMDMFGIKVQISGSNDNYLCSDKLTLAGALEEDGKKSERLAKKQSKIRSVDQDDESANDSSEENDLFCYAFYPDLGSKYEELDSREEIVEAAKDFGSKLIEQFEDNITSDIKNIYVGFNNLPPVFIGDIDSLIVEDIDTFNGIAYYFVTNEMSIFAEGNLMNMSEDMDAYFQVLLPYSSSSKTYVIQTFAQGEYDSGYFESEDDHYFGRDGVFEYDQFAIKMELALGLLKK